MSRLTVTSLGLLLAAAASSQFATSEWSAHFNDWSCYVMRSAGPLKVGGVNRVDVVITFYAPRTTSEMREPDRPDAAEPVILQVQVVPPFPSWHLFKERSIAVSAVIDESPVPMRPDAAASADARPAFVLGADAAAQVWREVRTGQDMELIVEYAEDQVSSLRVAPEQIAIAAAMMDSCVEESRQGQRG